VDRLSLGQCTVAATREYGARRALILDVLRRDFADRLAIVPSTAGLHLAAWLRGSADVSGVVQRAMALDRIEDGLRLLDAAW
jgi:DNA-binding transcriptional MocR family regulator